MRCGCCARRRRGRCARPATRICLVASGSGRSRIGDHSFEWSQHDVFSIPHWTWASHEALDGDADLFIVSDKSAYERLDLAARGTAIDAAIKAADEGIGASVRRVEDARLAARRRALCRRYRSLPGELHCGDRALAARACDHSQASMLRGRRAAPGVVAVFSGADMAADRVGPMRALWAIEGLTASRWRSRRAGRWRASACAMSASPSPSSSPRRATQPLDAAELVDDRLRALPAVVDAARSGDAPEHLHSRRRPGNVCFRWARGDEAAVQRGAAKCGARHARSISSTTG